MNLIETLEREAIDALTAEKPVPEFRPGDTLRVGVKVIEGERTRVQNFEGVCIARANKGVGSNFTVRKMSFDDWRNVLDVNLFGSFCMIKSVLEHMIERGSGRIVNISSVIGETGNVGQANYAASKAGLFGLTKSLALEMARRGITVNTVAPGFIETEMVGLIPKAALDAVVEKIPQRRLGKPEEVARVVQFLLEDESSYITGAVYTINGGLDM